MDAALIAVAHGSRSAAAQASVRALLDVVRALRPGLVVREAYVELAEPSLPAVLADTAGAPAVVVPLLLGNGYHVAHDVAGVTAAYRPDVPVAGALGPHPLLVEALAARLAEAEALCLDGLGMSVIHRLCTTLIPGPSRPQGPVVLAAAGSSDPRAWADTQAVAGMLSVRLGRAVVPAYASGSGPRVADAVAALRAAGRGPVSVATYLLSPGRFGAEVAACGADAVAAPLGPHPLLARLVLDRYDGSSPTRQSWRMQSLVSGSE